MATFLSQRWRQQPRVPVEVNWAHPISSKLVIAAQPNLFEGVSKRLSTVTGTVLGTLDGAVARGFTTKGISSTDRITTPYTNIGVDARSGFFQIFAVSTGPGTFGRLYQKGPTMSGSESMFLDTSLSQRIYAARRNSSGTVITELTFDASSSFLNRKANFSVSITGNTGKAWDGKSLMTQGTYTNQAGDATNNTDAFVIGNRVGGDRAFDGFIGQVYLWDRAISEAEVFALNENPWQIFKPQKQVFYSLPASTTATPSFGTFLARRWKQQPQGAVQVDWGHPLSNKLSAAITPLGELANGTAPTYPAGKPTFTTGSKGLYIQGNTSAYVDYKKPSYVPAPFTVFITLNTVVRVADAQTLVAFGGASTGYGWSISILANSTTLRFTYGGVADYVMTSSFFTAGLEETVALRVTATTANAFKRNFKSTDTAVGTGVTTSQPLRLLAVYNGSSILQQSPSAINGVLLMSRALSDNEIYAVIDNPWQIYKPKRQVFYSLSKTSYRSLILQSGRITQLPTGQEGTGKKPLVLHNGLIRQRSASEGTPIVLKNGILTTINTNTEDIII